MYEYENDEGVTGIFDTTENNTSFNTVFDSNGYNATPHTNGSGFNVFSDLSDGTSDIFIYRGHGNNGKIVFCTTDDIHLSQIRANSAVSQYATIPTYTVDDLLNNSLANLRCVLYIGCNTARDFITKTGITHNLIVSTYNKGAHFVLGTTEITYTSYNNAWLGYFLEAIEDGSCIGGAYIYAATMLGNVEIENKGTMPYPYRCIGDDMQYLN